MREKSLDITQILEDVVARVSEGLEIAYTDYLGQTVAEGSPHINYVFGNAQYVKSSLDEMSKGRFLTEEKLPLIALFTPVSEERGLQSHFAAAKVSLLIACKTNRDWSNEQRREYSFANVLRPIYGRLLEELRKEPRLDFGYRGEVRHEYSENYSYGKYGAFTAAGEEVSEPIDAIDIRNLELTINQPTCR